MEPLASTPPPQTQPQQPQSPQSPPSQPQPQPAQNPKSALYELCQKYRFEQPQLIYQFDVTEKKGTATLTLTYKDLDTAAASHQMSFTAQAQPKKIAEQQVCRQALEDPGLLALVGVRQVQLQALEKAKPEKKPKKPAEGEEGASPEAAEGEEKTPPPKKVGVPATIEAPPGSREAIEELNRKCQTCQLKPDYTWTEAPPDHAKGFMCTLNITYKDEAAAQGKVAFPSVSSKVYYTTKKAAQRDCAKAALAHPGIRTPLEMLMVATKALKQSKQQDKQRQRLPLQNPYFIPYPGPVYQKKPKPKLGKVEAIYSYGPDIETFDASMDLQFNTGDVITVVERLDQDWLKGELKGKRGSVPLNFVKFVEEKASPPPANRGRGSRPPLLGAPWANYYGRGDPYRNPFPFAEYNRYPFGPFSPSMRGRGFKEWVPGSGGYGPLIRNSWYG